MMYVVLLTEEILSHAEKHVFVAKWLKRFRLPIMPGQRVQIFLDAKYFRYPNGRVFHCKKFIDNDRANSQLGKGSRVSLSQFVILAQLRHVGSFL